MSLSTQFRRSLFALPLLAVALLGLANVERPATATLQAWVPASDSCQAPASRLGARVLARMPGDLGPLNRRMRCAA